MMSVMRCLPQSVRAAIAACGIPEEHMTEIRLRAGSCSAVTYHKDTGTARKPLLTLCLTEEDLRGVLVHLCAGSVHAYDEGLLRGYFSPQTLPGVRVGAAGRLLCAGGRPQRLQSISSLCIRLPHTVRTEDRLHRTLRNLLTGQPVPQTESIPVRDASALVSTLFYSPPGEGKTTLLRCVIGMLCSVKNNAEPITAAVLDDGEELCGFEIADCTVDRFCGYPRGLGMEIATRAFAPQVMICDEIGSDAEAEEILRAQAGGIPLIATAHADSIETLLRRPCFRRLQEHGVFARYVRLFRAPTDGGFAFLCEDAV